jgi:polyferredoxin
MTSQPLTVFDRHQRPYRRRDLLRVPLLGRLARWKHGRSAMQVPLLILAALVIYDGLVGPSLAPKNLAGVLPWVHWRGLVVLALLLVGNLFCMACPFMLPRRLAKKLGLDNRSWPRWLPGKWLAAGLLVAYFWVYEAFDLWSSPWLTAWVVAGYFLAAFAVDAFFKGAAFCKHVCPIGQFNFVNSMISPAEVAVRNPQTCLECTTKDCISGRLDPVTATISQPGCELWLFQQRKVGNMDCTFCLDCVRACPYDNVGVLYRNPLNDLTSTANRSGIGRLGERLDYTALILILVFGSVVNAFGMVSPVYRLERWLSGVLGISNGPLLLLLIFLAGIAVIPVALTALAAWSSLQLAGPGGGPTGVAATAARYVPALIPLGFAMWFAHYGYHFFSGALTIVPVTQSFLADMGVGFLGEPRWDLAAILPVKVIDYVEMIALGLGFYAAIAALRAVAGRIHSNRSVALRAVTPWIILAALLLGVSVLLMSLPMDMRGVSLGS